MNGREDRKTESRTRGRVEGGVRPTLFLKNSRISLRRGQTLDNPMLTTARTRRSPRLNYRMRSGRIIHVGSQSNDGRTVSDLKTQINTEGGDLVSTG